MSELFRRLKRRPATVAFLSILVLGIGYFIYHHQQTRAIEIRIRGLLTRGQKLKFSIPIVRETHSRIITDQKALDEFAKTLVINNYEFMNPGAVPAAGGTAIYIESADGPSFQLIVGESFLYAYGVDGAYVCQLGSNRAIKKAAEVAGFKYPLPQNFVGLIRGY